MSNTTLFNIDCTSCPRLSDFLAQNRITYPNYYARPVPAFGVKKAKLFIVGLAPGMHGANATGRPFTGDHAGIILYKMLHEHGFSNKSVSSSVNDGLRLKYTRISNAVKCLPPENKPISNEINNCNRYLVEELKVIDKQAVILSLGLIAHKAVIKALGLKQKDYLFKHGKLHFLKEGRRILNSYHCSRYNTNTGRLTEKMFSDIFKQAKTALGL